jgi:hypothetical protein
MITLKHRNKNYYKNNYKKKHSIKHSKNVHKKTKKYKIIKGGTTFTIEEQNIKDMLGTKKEKTLTETGIIDDILDKNKFTYQSETISGSTLEFINGVLERLLVSKKGNSTNFAVCLKDTDSGLKHAKYEHTDESKSESESKPLTSDIIRVLKYGHQFNEKSLLKVAKEELPNSGQDKKEVRVSIKYINYTNTAKNLDLNIITKITLEKRFDELYNEQLTRLTEAVEKKLGGMDKLKKTIMQIVDLKSKNEEIKVNLFSQRGGDNEQTIIVDNTIRYLIKNPTKLDDLLIVLSNVEKKPSDYKMLLDLINPPSNRIISKIPLKKTSLKSSQIPPRRIQSLKPLTRAVANPIYIQMGRKAKSLSLGRKKPTTQPASKGQQSIAKQKPLAPGQQLINPNQSPQGASLASTLAASAVALGTTQSIPFRRGSEKSYQRQSGQPTKLINGRSGQSSRAEELKNLLKLREYYNKDDGKSRGRKDITNEIDIRQNPAYFENLEQDKQKIFYSLDEFGIVTSDEINEVKEMNFFKILLVMNQLYIDICNILFKMRNISSKEDKIKLNTEITKSMDLNSEESLIKRLTSFFTERNKLFDDVQNSTTLIVCNIYNDKNIAIFMFKIIINQIEEQVKMFNKLHPKLFSESPISIDLPGTVNLKPDSSNSIKPPSELLDPTQTIIGTKEHNYEDMSGVLNPTPAQMAAAEFPGPGIYENIKGKFTV